MAQNWLHLVIFDDRANSVTKGLTEEIILGRPDQYCLIRNPPMLWYGFKGISDEPALMANYSDMPHDPDSAGQLYCQ